MNWDKITLTGLACECEIGFHRVEEKIRQKISIDLTAWVAPIPKDQLEKISSLRIDYFKAHNLIRERLGQKPFKLIETAAEEVAALILSRFDVEAVEVRVTKYPLDMKNAGSVTYSCRREK